MSLLTCPLCSSSLWPSSLEAHLRGELEYAGLKCALCPVRFTDDAAAAEHFGGLFPRHPGHPPQLLRLAKDEAKEGRLEELVRLARGGAEAVQERLCVCGRCRLVCRESEAGERRERPVKLHAPVQQKAEAETSTVYAASSMASEPIASERPSLLPESMYGGRAPHQPSSQPDAPPYEEAVAAPEDVKPNLADLKPQLAVDGKVACLLCSHRLPKEQFKIHGVQAHSETRPFSCLLCPQTEKTKGELAKHQKREHQVQTAPETFAFLGAEGEERELLERCFGAAKDVDYARLRCKPCDKLIKKGHVANHVVTNHLKKPLHACRLCPDYASVVTQKVKKHLKSVHKRQPDAADIDSSAAQHYAPIIKSMTAQLFERPAS